MYLERTLTGPLSRALRTFPAVLVTGPRQSGKTTFLRHELGKSHRYVSFDQPHVRERARSDPVGFLRDHPPPVILDEVQYAPDILSYVKSAIDADRRPGRWVLTGSQVFALMQGVGESLAGRVAVFELLPLSRAEIRRQPGPAVRFGAVLRRLLRGRTSAAPGRMPPARWILRGGYPEPWARRGVDRATWTSSYVQTYIERDVRSILRVGDLGAFQTFLRLVAARTAQVLNLSDLARDAGVTHPTARQWLTVLEASGQVFFLRPYHRSFGKRLIKAPKIYFLDTGVACWLVGLRDEAAVAGGPMAGALFESAVVADLVKAARHRGERAPLWFWRSRDGWEVDVVVEWAGRLHPIEIKLTATPRPSHAAMVARWRAAVDRQAGEGLVICDIRRPASLVSGVRAVSWDAL